jgi:hypothetical protein
VLGDTPPSFDVARPRTALVNSTGSDAAGGGGVVARKPEVFVRPVTPAEGRKRHDLGWPFSTWSLSKLRDVLRINQIADISRETLRKFLKDQGISWQVTKTWKAGKDPEFEQADAIGAYIRWRNQHAQPKRGFAVKSKIRLPDYLPYVA